MEPSGLWPSFPGEEDGDSLLTGEMSLLLWWFTAAGLEGDGDFTGICQEGIFGADGEGGNCLLAVDEEREKQVEVGDSPWLQCHTPPWSLIPECSGMAAVSAKADPRSTLCCPMPPWGRSYPPWQLLVCQLGTLTTLELPHPHSTLSLLHSWGKRGRGREPGSPG